MRHDARWRFGPPRMIVFYGRPSSRLFVARILRRNMRYLACTTKV